MYDDEEALRNVKQTAQTGIQVGKSIYQFLKNQKKDTLDLVGNQDFTFSGQMTDLSYFSKADIMPISRIESIQDPMLREAVKDNFNKAVKKGLVTIDNQRGTIIITNKGKSYINKPEFIKQAEIHQSNALQKILEQTEIYGVELDGTANDLNFFKFNDKLDVSDLMKSNDMLSVQKIIDNLEKWQKDGLVTLENGIAQITEKGKELLNNPLFQQGASGLTEKALSAVTGVVGKIFVITKRVIKAIETVNNIQSMSK